MNQFIFDSTVITLLTVSFLQTVEFPHILHFGSDFSSRFWLLYSFDVHVSGYIDGFDFDSNKKDVTYYVTEML